MLWFGASDASSILAHGNSFEITVNLCAGSILGVGECAGSIPVVCECAGSIPACYKAP